MAKLNGVQTLDMANGEITRVEYDGAEYVKVDGIKAGDIGLVMKGWGDQNIGEFFVVNSIIEALGNRKLVQISGNTCSASSYEDSFVAFRKASAPAAPNDEITDRVVSLESRVGDLECGRVPIPSVEIGGVHYAKVTDRKPKAGDFVKFDVSDDSAIKSSKYYVIIEIDEDDDPVYVDENGHRRCLCGYHVYEKVSASHSKTITHNGAEYTQVNRKAQAGDVVVFANTDHPKFLLFAGKPYAVTDVINDRPRFHGEDGSSYNVYNDVTYPQRTVDNVKVFAPITKAQPQYREVKREAKLGELIKIVKAFGAYGYENGDVRKVTKVNPETVHRCASVRIEPDDAKVLTQEYVVLEPVKEATLQVGDYARTLTPSKYGKISAGEIVKVREVDYEGKYIVTETNALFLPNQLKKVSAEAAKWAKIGRKHGELKLGDIVQRSPGFIDVVTYVHGGLRLDEGEKLITPVEARVDLHA